MAIHPDFGRTVRILSPLPGVRHSLKPDTHLSKLTIFYFISELNEEKVENEESSEIEEKNF